MSIEHFPKFADGEAIDFDTGDTFTADFAPAGYEDAPTPVFKGVRVRVGEFDDDEGAYAWCAIDADTPEVFRKLEADECLQGGYGFDEFTMIRNYKQA